MERRLSVTNLSSEKNFADVLTEFSSRHQGESERSVKQRCYLKPCTTKDTQQRTALKDLRGLEDEVILPADKGNVTVMMRRCDYDGKMEEMLGTGTYRRTG